MSLPLYYFLAISAVYVLMSWALYLPYRVAHLHFLTVANMAISGYLAGWLVMTLGFPFWLALLIGFAAGGLLGFIVAQFIGDAPTFAVVIVGFTFIYITRTVIENTEAVGGTLGMFGLPAITGNPVGHRWVLLAILLFLVVLVGFLIHRFERSRLGRAAAAIFVDKDLAASSGWTSSGWGSWSRPSPACWPGGAGSCTGGSTAASTWTSSPSTWWGSS